MSYAEPHDPDDPMPFDHEAVRRAIENVETAGRHVGLHMERATPALPAQPDPDGGPVLIVADFAVGDLAFTDRVLHPAVEEDNKAVRVMEVDADLGSLAEFKRRLQRERGPIDELEAE